MTSITTKQASGAGAPSVITLKDVEDCLPLTQPLKNLIMAYTGRPELLNQESGVLILTAWKGSALISRFMAVISPELPTFEQIKRLHSAVMHLGETAAVSKVTVQFHPKEMPSLALAPVLEVAKQCHLLKALDKALVTIYQKIEILIPKGKITLIKEPTGAAVRNWMLENQAFLSTIINLDLSSSNLKVLPLELTLFKNLESLTLKDNELETFPGFCADFAHLDVLDLSDNQLSVLPDFVCDYPKLTLLDLSNNFSLQTVPNNIGNLPLTHLFLDGTQVTTLPASCSHLTKLSSFDDTVEELMKGLKIDQDIGFTGGSMDTSEL